jgi:hypothetical protein
VSEKRFPALKFPSSTNTNGDTLAQKSLFNVHDKQHDKSFLIIVNLRRRRRQLCTTTAQ